MIPPSSPLIPPGGLHCPGEGHDGLGHRPHEEERQGLAATQEHPATVLHFDTAANHP